MPDTDAPPLLAGKVAIVTGASRGIGRAIALRLARAGCDVAAVYFNAHDEARKLCDEVAALGRRAAPIAANAITPRKSCQESGYTTRQGSSNVSCAPRAVSSRRAAGVAVVPG